MDLWQSRHQAEAALNSTLANHRALLAEGFELLDGAIDVFRERRSESSFIRICGLILTKARNTALGLYSLSLDGLGQEAGAMLRPLIEQYELLEYIRQEPSRVKLILDEKLPPAGERAKAIQGDFQNLRSYLNENASHFGFTYESMKHLLPGSEEGWRVIQPYSEHALKVNLGVLFGILTRILVEASNCFREAGIQEHYEGLSVVASLYRDKGIVLFDIR
jgi:hypothetical protein